MARNNDPEHSRLDDAARAGWLYYVADNSQDEIARKLGVSRQVAQRLVSLAVSRQLIKVRLDHPVAACMALGQKLQATFGLQYCNVVPSDPESRSTTLGTAQAAADCLEHVLRSPTPMVIALGTGRSVRAAVTQLPKMDCPQHKIISLMGNIAADGSASFFDVISGIADRINAPHFPLPVPVFVSSPEEKDAILTLRSVQNIYALAARAAFTMVGIGNIGDDAPLLLDGFIDRNEMRVLVNAGAVGEIGGRAFSASGVFLEGLTNERVVGAPVRRDGARVIGVAMGVNKRRSILGALRGQLVNGLITDEATATALLDMA
ncbi:MAG: sugar-binding transcriptional regulator [Hyphomicrobiales bacterium]|nr:sugar-binding transcriptional regulator [Hyphomicrobiales bacterium]